MGNSGLKKKKKKEEEEERKRKRKRKRKKRTNQGSMKTWVPLGKALIRGLIVKNK